MMSSVSSTLRLTNCYRPGICIKKQWKLRRARDHTTRPVLHNVALNWINNTFTIKVWYFLSLYLELMEINA